MFNCFSHHWLYHLGQSLHYSFHVTVQSYSIECFRRDCLVQLHIFAIIYINVQHGNFNVNDFFLSKKYYRQ